MRRFASLGLLVLLFYSCIGIEESNQLLDGHRPEMVITDSIDDIISQDTTIEKTFRNSPNISSFSEFPEDIDGCSCSFSFNKEDLENWEFIYVDDYHEELGYISLNDSIIRLELKNPAANDYHVSFEVEEEKQIGQELLQQTGIMTITGPNNETYNANYIGNCGC